MANRRFRYALEPVLKRADWRVSEATRALADATAAWSAQREQHAGLETEHAQAAALLDRGEGLPIDVAQRGHALRFLGQVRARIEDSARALQACAVKREDAQRTLAEAHRAMELLVQHKDESRRAHAAEAARQAAIAADDDWTARQAWQQAGPEADPARAKEQA